MEFSCCSVTLDGDDSLVKIDLQFLRFSLLLGFIYYIVSCSRIITLLYAPNLTSKGQDFAPSAPGEPNCGVFKIAQTKRYMRSVHSKSTGITRVCVPVYLPINSRVSGQKNRLISAVLGPTIVNPSVVAGTLQYRILLVHWY